ncbi:flavin reductase family protein [Evansella sp. AB-rgal1]|uniref:flavin reductase family protein n=1 Tax=Evansella sp. AB-rgal1 TaxID=3242696 RepID=UPI00359D3275
MNSIDPKALTKRENYKLLSGFILPRPIAFVTSMSSEGVINAAPFSFFNVVSAEPPLVSISIGRKGSVQKDTARNIVDQEEFVVHIVDENNVEAMNATAANLPPDESEVEAVELTTVESDVVKVPGLKEAPIRFECKLEKHLTFQEGETSTDFIIGRVVNYHISEGVHQDGEIDVTALNPIGRLAGKDYTKLGEIFSLERPD